MSEFAKLVEKARAFPSLFNLTGKTALVVGGNKGIGQAMCLGLAAAGADVCVAARGPDGLEETAEGVTALGRRGMSVAVDVTDEGAVEDLVAKTAGTLGGPDILVNSQGTVHLQDSVDYDMKQWQRVMDVNIKSLVMTCKHAGRVMLKKGWGKIINITSVRSFQGRIGDLAYAPSKGAVNQLTRSLAIEWGPKGVNVNAIAPVFTRTAISAPVLDIPATRAWALSRIPIGRLGEVEDYMGPIVFLASDASSFVNGHVLMVDGGWVSA